MLNLPPALILVRPRKLKEALAYLDAYAGDVRVMAGGTDLVPNLKHGLYDERKILSLSRLSELDFVEISDAHIDIGVLLTLDALSHHDTLVALLPALTRAASLVAGPQLRQMGTIGGNLCLDTRCVYINQTHFWRQSLGFCLKKDGTKCHVVETGKRCVAAASNDTAPVLISLDASVLLQSIHGERWVGLDAFYKADGVWNKVIERNELMTRIRVPMSAKSRQMAYEKLRQRGAIDFPWLSLALSYVRDDSWATDVRLIVSAIASKPKKVRLPGHRFELSKNGIESLCEVVFKQTKPLSNINANIEWRREMVKHLTRRAVEQSLTPGSESR